MHLGGCKVHLPLQICIFFVERKRNAANRVILLILQINPPVRPGLGAGTVLHLADLFFVHDVIVDGFAGVVVQEILLVHGFFLGYAGFPIVEAILQVAEVAAVGVGVIWLTHVALVSFCNRARGAIVRPLPYSRSHSSRFNCLYNRSAWGKLSVC